MSTRCKKTFRKSARCPVCHATILVVKQLGGYATIDRLYAVADHLKTLHPDTCRTATLSKAGAGKQ